MVTAISKFRIDQKCSGKIRLAKYLRCRGTQPKNSIRFELENRTKTAGLLVPHQDGEKRDIPANTILINFLKAAIGGRTNKMGCDWNIKVHEEGQIAKCSSTGMDAGTKSPGSGNSKFAEVDGFELKTAFWLLAFWLLLLLLAVGCGICIWLLHFAFGKLTSHYNFSKPVFHSGFTPSSSIVSSPPCLLTEVIDRPGTSRG